MEMTTVKERLKSDEKGKNVMWRCRPWIKTNDCSSRAVNRRGVLPEVLGGRQTCSVSALDKSLGIHKHLE